MTTPTQQPTAEQFYLEYWKVEEQEQEKQFEKAQHNKEVIEKQIIQDEKDYGLNSEEMTDEILTENRNVFRAVVFKCP